MKPFYIVHREKTHDTRLVIAYVMVAGQPAWRTLTTGGPRNSSFQNITDEELMREWKWAGFVP